MIALRDSLNAGRLPEGYFAMAEQRAGGDARGSAVAASPPQARIVVRSEAGEYARRADRITVRDDLGEVVSVVAIVSPGNKESRHAIRSFTEKTAELLGYGVNVLVVDLFPPGPRDSQGIHKLIWDEIGHEVPFELPPDKQLTLAAYSASPPITGYVEPVAAGDVLPDMPLFLRPDRYVPCPLEQSYQAAWAVMPVPIRRLLEPPAAWRGAPLVRLVPLLALRRPANPGGLPGTAFRARPAQSIRT